MAFSPSPGLLGSTPAHVDGAALARLLESPDGPVMRDMAERANRVKDAAVQQCGVSEVPGPDSHLADTIVTRFQVDGQGPHYQVGTSHPRGRMHHNGTNPHGIDPVNASVLRFEVDGVVVYAQHVEHPGTAPNRFLTDNLRAGA